MGKLRRVPSKFNFVVWPIAFAILVSGAVALNTANGQTAHGASASIEQSSWKAWERITDDQAWALLPALAKADKQPLPNWIKPVVIQMPRTAAAMLELDTAFRDGRPLDAGLRADTKTRETHGVHPK